VKTAPGQAAGAQIATPRCLHPLKFYNLDEPRDDLAPVCWRPAGHPRPDVHISRYAYLKMLARGRANRRKYGRSRRSRRGHPVLSDPPASLAS
jgi:hypothetical protein